mgnify:CR=1 FL=1
MNESMAILRHPYFSEVHEKIGFEIEGIQVITECNRGGMTLTLRGESEEKKKVFFTILDLLFAYLGGFPEIIELVNDGCYADASKLAGRYKTSSYFTKKNLCQCKINAESFNATSLTKFFNMHINLPTSSMQYLVSKNYEHVVTNHKITLLLHVIDGVVDNNRIKEIQSELIDKYQIPPDYQPGKYTCKAYQIFQDTLFRAEANYSCEILQLLNVSEYSFLQVITDTRNMYSHFSSKKGSDLQRGVEMIIYFEIVHYCIRSYIINALDVEIDEEQDKEFYYSVHDWILEILYDRRDDIKSKTYKNVASFEQMRIMVEKLVHGM